MTLEKATNAIKQLESINPLEEYAYEKALFAYRTIKHLPILIHELPEDLRLCRTRTHTTSDLYKTVGEISNPSYQFVKEFARCNRPFQPKFTQVKQDQLLSWNWLIIGQKQKILAINSM